MKKKHKINGEEVTRYRCKAEITYGSKVFEPQDYYIQDQRVARIYSLDGESLWEMKESILETMDLEKITEEDHKKSTETRGVLIEFLDQLRDYFSESGANISQDERESSEFVDFFFKNIDEKFIKDINEKLIVSEKKSMANMFNRIFGKAPVKEELFKNNFGYEWGGVKYAEFTGTTTESFTNGKIYRLEQGSIFCLIDDNNHRMHTNIMYRFYNFKPSTEQKYRTQEMNRQFKLPQNDPLTRIEEKMDKILQKTKWTMNEEQKKWFEAGKKEGREKYEKEIITEYKKNQKLEFYIDPKKRERQDFIDEVTKGLFIHQRDMSESSSFTAAELLWAERERRLQ